MRTTTDVRVPLVDLITPHSALEPALTAVFRKAVTTAQFVGGPMVDGFEREFAAFCGVQHCIGVASGTDALRFALIAAGVASGDVVITVANTFIATVEAICQAGALPAFVDVDPCTYTLDQHQLRRFIEHGCTRDSRTGRLISNTAGRPVSAIVPVHLYGQMAEMDPILEIAAEHQLLVIEDACQAHGAAYFSKRRQQWFAAGTMGQAAAFSFYPGKNLGACGEAGAITTNDPRLADVCRMLRNHGQSTKYFHDIEGYNGRLDAIQAGLLAVKLPFLAGWNDQRRAVARRYDVAFGSHPAIVTPHVSVNMRPVYHLYVVRVAQRELVQAQLANVGVDTGIHYPVPLHRSGAYKDAQFPAGELSVTERAATEVLSLPLFPGLSEDDQQYVIGQVLNAVSTTAVEARAV